MLVVGQFLTEVTVAFGDKSLRLNGDFLAWFANGQGRGIGQHVLVKKQVLGIPEDDVRQHIAFGKEHLFERGIDLHLLGKTGITELKEHIAFLHEVEGLVPHLLAFFFVFYLVVHIGADQGNQQNDNHTNLHNIRFLSFLRLRFLGLGIGHNQPHNDQYKERQRPEVPKRSLQFRLANDLVMGQALTIGIHYGNPFATLQNVHISLDILGNRVIDIHKIGVVDLIGGIDQFVDIISHVAGIVRLHEVVARKQRTNGIVPDNNFTLHQPRVDVVAVPIHQSVVHEDGQTRLAFLQCIKIETLVDLASHFMIHDFNRVLNPTVEELFLQRKVKEHTHHH